MVRKLLRPAKSCFPLTNGIFSGIYLRNFVPGRMADQNRTAQHGSLIARLTGKQAIKTGKE